MKLILIYLAIINISTFLLYGLDKWKAQKGRRRIPEKTLLGVAVAGGSVGAYCGMWFFRHKTKKPKFYIGVPMIMATQIVLWILWNNM